MYRIQGPEGLAREWTPRPVHDFPLEAQDVPMRSGHIEERTAIGNQRFRIEPFRSIIAPTQPH